MTIPVIAQILAILTLAGWTVYKEIRERSKTRRYDLAENPDRCHDHEMRLRSIESNCAEIKTEMAVVSTRMMGLERRVDDIAEIFNNAGGHV